MQACHCGRAPDEILMEVSGLFPKVQGRVVVEKYPVSSQSDALHVAQGMFLFLYQLQ